MTKSMAQNIFLGGSLFIIIIIFAGLSFHSHGYGMNVSTADAELTESVVAGKRFWEREACINCHTILGEGAYYAPEVGNVMARWGVADDPDAAFETLKSWMESMQTGIEGRRQMPNFDLPDEEVRALSHFLLTKKALEDQDEVNLGQISKAPGTRLKLHLDLAPEDVDRERLSGVHIYPEWDAATGTYPPNHVRVMDSAAEAEADPPPIDAKAQRRIRAVRRQFVALRPRSVSLPGQPDGDELDLDAAVRWRADLAATGSGATRIWRAVRPEARDLAVSILLDASRSTESAVTGRAVIDIERVALTVLQRRSSLMPFGAMCIARSPALRSWWSPT